MDIDSIISSNKQPTTTSLPKHTLNPEISLHLMLDIIARDQKGKPSILLPGQAVRCWELWRENKDIVDVAEYTALKHGNYYYTNIQDLALTPLGAETTYRSDIPLGYGCGVREMHLYDNAPGILYEQLRPSAHFPMRLRRFDDHALVARTLPLESAEWMPSFYVRSKTGDIELQLPKGKKGMFRKVNIPFTLTPIAKLAAIWGYRPEHISELYYQWVSMCKHQIDSHGVEELYIGWDPIIGCDCSKFVSPEVYNREHANWRARTLAVWNPMDRYKQFDHAREKMREAFRSQSLRQPAIDY